jgi:hypothetical protein
VAEEIIREEEVEEVTLRTNQGLHVSTVEVCHRVFYAEF